VDKARRLAPEYFEVHRVAASVYGKQGNIPAARQEYEAAIELEPDSAPIRVLYGIFLLEFLEDTAGALQQFQEAGKLDPGALEIQLHIARVSLALRHFDEARETINQLQARLNTEDTSEWVRRKIYDVHLQFFQRKADHLCSIKDRSGTVRCLADLKQAYQKCSPYLLDLRMEETISKAAQTATECADSIQDKATKIRINKLSKWFSSKARQSSLPNRSSKTLGSAARFQ
jgi:tetratricopeptide (TPR) repeat protein